ncbi:hypothetical protein [Epilithonimonas arachidiradicis]|uniref:Lipoprotein n=1 Tax=Epilithonimonas arachidiradicis TaxID=1617282 RepID=A0A420CXN8_9FLAO|nr:hypothetical protein [Epilithonimonas arachidiradicis]RKE83239.1 hypothetical protein BXY58_2793 [Epilithonimonas arachidiradicis]GGG65895.1 hypothetical protein GCM10007332_30650 [Epilithonimonas arachidiradicis]
MEYTKLSILLLAFTILSCDKKQDPKAIDFINQWEKLEIKTHTEKIIISKFSDSAKYEQNLNNIVFQILPEDGKLVEEKIVRKNIYFTKGERDSLAKYIYESVTKPKFTSIIATEYSGSVSLNYDTGSLRLICEYNSTGNWSAVSDETKKIYTILSKKVEISKN